MCCSPRLALRHRTSRQEGLLLSCSLASIWIREQHHALSLIVESSAPLSPPGGYLPRWPQMDALGAWWSLHAEKGEVSIASSCTLQAHQPAAMFVVLLCPAFNGTSLAPLSSSRCRWLPTASCPQWLNDSEVSCEHRASFFSTHGLNFYSNEVTLHGGSAVPGSARACPQVRSHPSAATPM